MLSNTLIK